ncbi:hypothetical protein KAFR_0D04420 [Kazachstania africana CBS 2517]|uniref:Nuclear condensin complex subunit 3 C-terminal domain-containing protein n=1 Tax=Kazachstania africana (strain ATCC 22294 / BCRC 22015 / CBS 2517 / CECT 1963 / NBRC 1671 / NRRL Y-8276) TaxID=1071382 RepID=H2AUP0_KAZAF|nr:hypothetical protein KAFR_0D04420 [Kazachstania africana CBS 2517]CCF58090.1 hypothetical protein KAFR_0D04420 [Kazachstania africana CBS 2517]
MQYSANTDSVGEDDVHNKIFNSIAHVFQQAQLTYAGHRKHVAVLKKIQGKALSQGYEDAFNYWFNKIVTRVLPLKKSEVIGDRIVKLTATFIASLDREIEIMRKNNHESLSQHENMFNKFVDCFIRHILRGVESKDKNVRYRVLQLLVIIMDNLGEIDEDLYNLLMWSLSRRIFDKEASVRIQAVFCLTKFQDDNSESADNEATQTLMRLIQNDPSAEVRRAAMLNIVNNKSTRPHILERSRDVNPINRRLIYSKVLKSMNKKCFTDLDTRILDQLIEWGLNDREEPVRKACEKLISYHWVNLLDGDLIELLENLDIAKSNGSIKALETLFKIRPDILTKIKFPDDVWNQFTVEIAFIFRSFYIYCNENTLTEILDDTFPEASKLSNILNFYLEKRFHCDTSALPDIEKEHLEFIIEQILVTANKYDYSDEVGRRSMLNVIRNMLHLVDLSKSLIRIGHEVLKTLSINERDFVTMAVEIINDLRDDDIEKQEEEEKTTKKSHEDEDEEDDIASFHSAVENLANGEENTNNQLKRLPNEREARAETIVLCLTRSAAMLELVDASLEQSIMISSLIDTLIIPAVRSTEPDVRELGVRNLGLCCLLDIQLAIENMYILGMCVSKGNASLKHIALQAIVDIFSVHENAVVDGENKVDSISLHKIFYKVLKNNNLPECQVIAAEGLCKLFLGDIFTDDDLFETLVLSYFSPVNSSNEALIQAFAFCIPVYCFSHPTHQVRMARVAADVLMRLCILWDELQSSDDEKVDKSAMLKPNIILQQLIFWTDPRKVVNRTDEESSQDSVQIGFLLDILKIFNQIEKKEIKKMIVTNIQTFYVTSKCHYALLKEAAEHIEDILENETLDNTSMNSLERFKGVLNAHLTEAHELILNSSKRELDTSATEHSVVADSKEYSSENSEKNDIEMDRDGYPQTNLSPRVLGNNSTEQDPTTHPEKIEFVSCNNTSGSTDEKHSMLRKRNRNEMEESIILNTADTPEKNDASKTASVSLSEDMSSDVDMLGVDNK